MANWGEDEAMGIDRVLADRVGEQVHVSWVTRAASKTVYEVEGQGTVKTDDVLRHKHRVSFDAPSASPLRVRVKLTTADAVVDVSGWVSVP